VRHANYRICRENREVVVIEDVGPWSEHPTVTNDAEWVVHQLAGYLCGRRLFYFDSMGALDELLVSGDHFAGFAPGSVICGS
jgi:hypothetical protein